MSEGDAGQRVEVNVRRCPCPGTPHPNGDIVYLAPEASMTMGLKANGAINKAGGDEVLLELHLGRVFLEEGIVGWTFVENEEDGDRIVSVSVPITPDAIERLLPWAKGGSDVAERANELYAGAVIAPLVRRSMSSSGLMPTNGSTSHTRSSRQKRPSSSKSSSPASSVTSP